MVAATSAGNAQTPENDVKLKEAYEGKFLIGTALSTRLYSGRDTVADAVIKKYFNAIVPENDMKSMSLQPREGEFFFDNADRFVAFGEQNGMTVTGHCLIWHSQAPRWFFSDETGADVSREVLIERMRKHITTVVSRYKGRIKGWDVVNEAIMEDGSYRRSKFYQIIGEDFIPLAFQFAHEADPDCELYYNDYNMAFEGKRNTVVALIKKLKEKGIRIDAVGMQSHIHLDSPDIGEFEKSIQAYIGAGVKVMFTELDLDALPSRNPNQGANISDTQEYAQSLNPYPDGLPSDVEAKWEERYLAFFRLFLKYQKDVTRVTLWGVSDRDSWLNGFPIRGRTNYPLFFDRNYKPKPIVAKVAALAQ
jgi:endo-1,4-beta-xylanase